MAHGEQLTSLPRTNHGNAVSIWVGSNYIQKMIKEFKLETAKAATATGSRPPVGLDVDHDEDKESNEQYNYRSIVGRLQWLTGCRLDIQYAVKELARGSNNVRPSSWTKVKHLIKHLQGTVHYRLFNQMTTAAGVQEIDVMSDADWAWCPESRKSTSGYCVQVMGSLIHAASRTQGR